MRLYHGTHIQNLQTLKPIATRGNAISTPVVCFSPNPHIALFYIWNRSYKWVAFSENEQGKVVFTEHYNNMLFDFYNGISGSIYECNGNNPHISLTHMNRVYISELPILVENEIIIPNVYDEILKQEALENIIIQRYDHLSTKEKDRISKTTVRAIHMQKLLFHSKYASITEQANFVKSHFPEEWKTALKMSAQEIEQMINEWRVSLHNKK